MLDFSFSAFTPVKLPDSEIIYTLHEEYNQQ